MNAAAMFRLSLDRANSHLRYWWWRRRHGSPGYTLWTALGEWRRRFAFEWRHARIRNIRGEFRDVKQGHPKVRES